MTLKQIEYFQMVCEKENISAAADALFVSRSVVSRTISELEDEFGASLFIRSRNGVVLTKSGQILAKLFEAFTDSYLAVKDRISKIRTEEQSKPLRLGVTPTNAYCIYRNFCGEFIKQHPNVRLYVEEHSAADSWKLLQNGHLDALFTPAQANEPAFESMELYQNPIMVGVQEHSALSEKETISIADILDLPLGFFNAPMPIENTLNACFAALGKVPNVVIRTSDQMLLQQLTQEGQIYPILPLDMMATWSGVRQIPLDFVPPSTNRLVWNRALAHGDVLDEFLDFMRTQVKP